MKTSNCSKPSIPATTTTTRSGAKEINDDEEPASRIAAESIHHTETTSSKEEKHNSKSRTKECSSKPSTQEKIILRDDESTKEATGVEGAQPADDGEETSNDDVEKGHAEVRAVSIIPIDSSTLPNQGGELVGCQGCCSCPHGKTTSAFLISLVWVAYIFSGLGSANCQFLVVASDEPGNDYDYAFGDTINIGLMRHQDASLYSENAEDACVIWGQESHQPTWQQQQSLWVPIRTLIVVTTFLSFAFAVGVSSLACVRYHSTAFVCSMGVGMLIPLLYGMSFTAYASNICLSSWSNCSIGTGTVLMILSLPSWLIALWALDRMAALVAQQSPLTKSSLQAVPPKPSRICMALSVVVVATIVLVNLLVLNFRTISNYGNDANPFHPQATQRPWDEGGEDERDYPPTLAPMTECIATDDPSLTLDMSNLASYSWNETIVSRQGLEFSSVSLMDDKFVMSRNGRRVAIEVRDMVNGTGLEYLVVFETPGTGCEHQWTQIGGDILAISTSPDQTSFGKYCGLDMDRNGERLIVSDCNLGLVEVWELTPDSKSWHRIRWFKENQSEQGMGLGFFVSMSEDGSRIAMTSTPGQIGSPEGIARIFEWGPADRFGWVLMGHDIRIEGVDTNFDGVDYNLQYSHLVLAPSGNRALIVGQIPFKWYARIIDWNGSSWEILNSDPGLMFEMSNTSNFNAQFNQDGTKLAIGWKDYNDADWSARAVVLDEANNWVPMGSRLSEISYYWRPEISISDDATRVAVRAWVNDTVGLLSLVWDDSSGDWVPIGTSIELKGVLWTENFQMSGAGDLAMTYGTGDAFIHIFRLE